MYLEKVKITYNLEWREYVCVWVFLLIQWRPCLLSGVLCHTLCHALLFVFQYPLFWYFVLLGLNNPQLNYFVGTYKASRSYYGTHNLINKKHDEYKHFEIIKEMHLSCLLIKEFFLDIGTRFLLFTSLHCSNFVARWNKS